MPELSDIRKQVEARLKELERTIEPLREEYEQLKRAAAAFGDEASARVGRVSRGRASRPGGKRRGRPRGSGGRAQQALKLVGEQPGITIAEMGKRMGISPNYLYRVLPQLQEEGKVTKRGKGYHPAGG